MSKIVISESELKEIIKESIENIINEGQGTDMFRHIYNRDPNSKDNFGTQFSNLLKKDSPERNFIRMGGCDGDDPKYNRVYRVNDPKRGYAADDWSTLFDRTGTIHDDIFGKMDRAIGLTGGMLAQKAKQKFNKMRKNPSK